MSINLSSGDWVTIIASVIAFIASIITIISSSITAKRSNEVAEKLAALESITQDKQRIVENIGSQRVFWINNIRDNFVEYNSNAQKFHFAINLMDTTNQRVNTELLIELPESMMKTIYNIELFLNGEETYSKATISLMKDFRNQIISGIITSEFNSTMEKLIFIQNVILKSEWKRVKKETEKGEFLTDREVEVIFEEVAKGLNPVLHATITLVHGKQHNSED